MNNQDEIYKYKYLKYYNKYTDLKSKLVGGAKFNNVDINTFIPGNMEELLGYINYLNDNKYIYIHEGILSNLLIRFYRTNTNFKETEKAARAKEFIIKYEPKDYPDQTPVKVLLDWFNQNSEQSK
jgi:hypothetical protein